MSEQTIQASTFKATCLQLLDQVAATHQTVVITKHGKPVARLVPLDAGRSTAGSVTLLADDDEDYFSTGEHWDAEA
ncbi:MAG TPA: type II toxin-antitoxin system Phd/YefM family antitoxin [Trueperaceae bacterium]|nr:type II toxin-antitoxin system Phd/YefM family antitoxin [Trueperaceae bacterium]